MSKITPQSFSRNAENQLAATLEQKVERFRKSKVKRLDQAREISRWAYMLFDLVNKLSVEPAMPSPVPPLAPATVRKQPSYRFLHYGAEVQADDEYQFGGDWKPAAVGCFIGHIVTQQEEHMSNFRRKE